MKKLLLILLLLSTLNTNAQHKYSQSDDKSGLMLATVGCVSMTIGLFVPDGSEWSWKSQLPNNNEKIVKPFYKNPSRDCCILFGLVITIGGLNYQHNQR